MRDPPNFARNARALLNRIGVPVNGWSNDSREPEAVARALRAAFLRGLEDGREDLAWAIEADAHRLAAQRRREARADREGR